MEIGKGPKYTSDISQNFMSHRGQEGVVYPPATLKPVTINRNFKSGTKAEDIQFQNNTPVLIFSTI